MSEIFRTFRPVRPLTSFPGEKDPVSPSGEAEKCLQNASSHPSKGGVQAGGRPEKTLFEGRRFPVIPNPARKPVRDLDVEG